MCGFKKQNALLKGFFLEKYFIIYKHFKYFRKYIQYKITRNILGCVWISQNEHSGRSTEE